MLAEQNIEEYVPVPQIAGGDEGEFVLRVKGDSMKDAGILEGDYVVVRPQETATDGEIVVAMMEGEATVKRFFKEKDHVRLQPENDALEPIYARDVDIAGPRRGGVQEGGMTTGLLETPAFAARPAGAGRRRDAGGAAGQRAGARRRRGRGRVPRLPGPRCTSSGGQARCGGCGLRRSS